jgi:hypothetical protein
MSQTEHKKCFDRMFPDDLHLRSNQPNKGKVFTVWMGQLQGAVLPVRTITHSSGEEERNRESPRSKAASDRTCSSLDIMRFAGIAVDLLPMARY